ncbi:HlyD family secretion protein [Methylobacterium sp. WL64]|uniref:HlyD family secretion protein n=1 Tax=Methylobacterium sp. WL64 TaxID=2603894 RepID=UPI0011C85B02|nr:HlyD family secretion protein [Methylobacterium sp. WL64]TXM98845.1 HlyD family secretion protein [Methylobacterium sp. WL64]
MGADQIPTVLDQGTEARPADVETRSVVQSKTPRPTTPRRVLAVAVVAALLAAGGGYGYHYWTLGRFLEATDDAYVKADYTIIAPKVAGYLSDVLVADNQVVKAGQTLARIDDRDFQSALAQALADVQTARAAIRNVEAQITLQSPIVEQQDAAIAATEANLAFAEAEFERYTTLVKSGAGTVQRAQQTEAALRAATAQLRRDRAAKLAAQSTIHVLKAERHKAQAVRDKAETVLAQAELNLTYTTVIAPVDGTVGAKTLRVGQYVTAGTQLMAVVPLDSAYVVANYKETQLARVRAGQPVEVEVDALPGVRLSGRVDSVSPASGLEFALLPPDNATGNFTKIVQRIPVKIVFEPGAATERLRAGMSVAPTIDTRDLDLVAAVPATAPAGRREFRPLVSVNDVPAGTSRAN